MRGFDSYLKGVRSGRLLVGEKIRQAVERHYADLENPNFYFDRVAAQRAIDFFSFCTHFKGEKAGQELILEPWQRWVVGSLYGWKRKNGKRKYTEGYVEVPKKNGKTILASGIGLYGFLADGEKGADVVAAAYTTEQAKLCLDGAKDMVKNSPYLKELVQLYEHRMVRPSTKSKFFAVSHDPRNTEGKGGSTIIIDEYHVHKKDELKDSLRTGQMARANPMMFTITTAGSDRQGPCYKFREHLTNVLKGQFSLDNIFICIYDLDDGDDWTDEKNWAKANPNLNVSVDLDGLRDAFDLACISGQKEVEFKTKHLNYWVDAAEVWIKDADWMGQVDLEKKFLVPQKKIYAGLDLATTQDYSAFSLFSEIDHEKFYLKTWYWICEDQYKNRVASMPALREWRKQPFLRVCPGNSVDLEIIHQDIKKIWEEYQIHMMAFDRYKADAVTQPLTIEMGTVNNAAGKPVDRVQGFGQNIGTMNAPTKELERMVLEKKIFHDGNPITRWMLGNVSLKMDHNGNIKPDKAASSEKIDGIIASVMAIGMWLDNNYTPVFRSKYEDEGIFRM